MKLFHHQSGPARAVDITKAVGFNRWHETIAYLDISCLLENEGAYDVL